LSNHEGYKDDSYDWLVKYPPVTRAGDSLFVYYVPEIPAE
jgi:hypothetical protein